MRLGSRIVDFGSRIETCLNHFKAKLDYLTFGRDLTQPAANWIVNSRPTLARLPKLATPTWV